MIKAHRAMETLQHTRDDRVEIVAGHDLSGQVLEEIDKQAGRADGIRLRRLRFFGLRRRFRRHTTCDEPVNSLFWRLCSMLHTRRKVMRVDPQAFPQA